MHVYIRETAVSLEMREADAEGLVEGDAELFPVAFYADGNERPSFRAILPPETLMVLEEALLAPVQLGLLAEEPENPDGEVHAMVGLTLPVEGLPGGAEADDEDDDEEEEDDGREPWATSNPDAWRGEGDEEEEGEDGAAAGPRTVFLAFAPLVRLARKFPLDFGEELADLLESALAGDTKPNLQARVDRMLGGL